MDSSLSLFGFGSFSVQCCRGHRNQFITYILVLRVILLQYFLAQKRKKTILFIYLHSYCGFICCDLEADGSPLATAQDAVAIGVEGGVRQVVLERQLSGRVNAGLGAVELRRRWPFL